MGLGLKSGRPRAVAEDIRRAIWAYMDATGTRGFFVKVLGDTAVVERFGGVLQIAAHEGGTFSLRYKGNLLAETAVDQSRISLGAMESPLQDWLIPPRL